MMANYESHYRSNYFRVKDPEAFETWAHKIGLPTWKETDGDGITRFGFGEVYGDLPSYYLELGPNDSTDESPDYLAEADYVEVDVVDELPQYLAENEVAIIQIIGWEKLRYLTGTAIAVHADGRPPIVLHIGDINTLVTTQWGVHASSPSY
jgi:hypothetical protein